MNLQYFFRVFKLFCTSTGIANNTVQMILNSLFYLLTKICISKLLYPTYYIFYEQCHFYDIVLVRCQC
jgi:hypothetical protein